MPQTILVTKRNGTTEPLDLSKFHRVVEEACKGIPNVSASQIELNSHVQFYAGIKTSDIQETLIKSAQNLISEETPEYQHVAGRLINYHLRKEVYGGHEIPMIDAHYHMGVEEGFYSRDLIGKYTPEEWREINNYIKHDRDFNIVSVGMEQFRSKYLVKNRVTGEHFETPQMTYMLIAMFTFQNYRDSEKMQYVKDYYDAISQHEISLPTPLMAGLRTPIRQFSSCVLIEMEDSLDSIIATSGSVIKYVSQKAGIGLGLGSLRALNSPIRGGNAYHTGPLPIYRLMAASVKSCNAGGVRSGAATFHFPIWHLDLEDMIVLKNNKGTEETRVRSVDYSVQISKLFYERFLKNDTITLFSPSDVPGLYEAFFADQDEFTRLYLKAEKEVKRKKVVKAVDLFNMIMQERKDTGRIYIMNVDHCNTHGSFDSVKAPVRMSNLCQEITLPTKPLRDLKDENGWIALCTLSAFNLGKVKKPSDFERLARLAVRALNELLDYQDYPMPAAEKHTKYFRPLGIGVINLAYFLAKNNVKYSDDSGLALVNEYMEAMSYYLIKASVDLAEEYGECEASADGLVKYAHGVFPIHTYKRDVDQLVSSELKVFWDELIERAKRWGIRNSTLMAQMPAETSAQIANATNGIEQIRSFITKKISKDGNFTQVAPDIKRLKNKYDLLWDNKTPEGYLKVCAVIQKYFDQSLSTNTSYNPEHFPKNEIPMSLLIGNLLLCYKWGIKTLYYNNTYDSQEEQDVNQLIKNQKDDTMLEDEALCDSCVI